MKSGVKVKTMDFIGLDIDDYGIEGEWSDPLEVSMPKNNVINTPIQQFLENHPILFQLFRRFLRL